MAANEIHKGDIGTIFEVTLKDDVAIVDVSSATTKEIFFRKPDGTTVLTKAAEFKTDGTDGIIQYTTILDDLDSVGGWKIQGHVILSTGEWKSDIASFKVYDNLA